MEESYSPDGWLGIILGSKLWMDFRKEPHKGIQQLMNEITTAAAGTVCCKNDSQTIFLFSFMTTYHIYIT